MVKQHQIRQIGNKDNLFLGADRELAMISATLSAVLIASVMEWSAFFTGLFLWFFCMWVLRIMAKSDPKMRGIYLRNRRYKKFYHAMATHFYINRIERK